VLYNKYMRIGLFDPLQLSFSIINGLIAKKIITDDEAKAIIAYSLPPEMSADEKKKFLDGIFIDDKKK
jgi:hypothetical protein